MGGWIGRWVDGWVGGWVGGVELSGVRKSSSLLLPPTSS